MHRCRYPQQQATPTGWVLEGEIIKALGANEALCGAEDLMDMVNDPIETLYDTTQDAPPGQVAQVCLAQGRACSPRQGLGAREPCVHVCAPTFTALSTLCISTAIVAATLVNLYSSVGVRAVYSRSVMMRMRRCSVCLNLGGLLAPSAPGCTLCGTSAVYWKATCRAIAIGREPSAGHVHMLHCGGH